MGRCLAALVRHGDYHQLANTPSAHQPFSLNDRGRRQAQEESEAFSLQLQTNQWQLIPSVQSSHMLRAWQTAQIFCQPLKANLPIEISCHDALAERGLGCAANLSIETIEQILHDDPRFPSPPADWKSNSHYRLPLQGAESLMQAGERVAAHIKAQISKLPRDDTVDRIMLFVGHGAAFRHAAHQLGILSFGQIAQLSMYHARPIYLEQLTNEQWLHIAGDWKVRTTDQQPLD